MTDTKGEATMVRRGQVAKTVSGDKELHPERYCKQCLWKTAMVNAKRDGYVLNANPCPRHEVGANQ